MDRRNTKQKTAIRRTFLEADRPLSPEEALKDAHRYQRKLGIATVYRNIQSLVEEGWLQRVEIPGDTARYEVAGKKHHHHFYCNSCDRLFELEDCAVPSKPRPPKGFRAAGHEFFLYGTCAECIPGNPRSHV
jgi:Fur family transcriptional regulator, ferric uptake regulator